MGFFKKLFGKKKNEIHLSAEEAFDNTETPLRKAAEVADPEPEKGEESAATVTVEVADDTTPGQNGKADPEEVRPGDFGSGEQADYKTVLVLRAVTFDNAALELRDALRTFARCVSESGSDFTLTLEDQSVLVLTHSPMPGPAGLPEGLSGGLEQAPKAVSDILNGLDQKLEILPLRRGGDFEASYAAFKSALMGKMNAYLLTDDRRLTDAGGKLLWDDNGGSDYPSAPEAIPAQSGEAPAGEEPAQEAAEEAPAQPKPGAPGEETPHFGERALRSMELIASHGIQLDCSHAVELDENRIYPRSVKETVERASALTATALIARAYSAAGNVSPAARSAALISRFDNLYGVKRQFTTKENAYLRDPGAGKHAVNALKAEAAQMLMWALGFVDLPWPDAPADLDRITEILRAGDLNTLCTRARPRDKQALLDMYDLTTRLHALCVRASAKDLKETGLDPDIIYERHYAFNWLLGIGGFTGWDNIIPAT